MESHITRPMAMNGFEIKLGLGWFLCATILTWAMAVQMFPSAFPGQSQTTHLMMAVAVSFGAVGSVLVHRMAQAVVARRLGAAAQTVRVFDLTAPSAADELLPSPMVEIRISLVGPICSIGLAAFFALSVRLTVEPTYHAVLGALSNINLAIALLGMIPSFPMNGGRLLRALLWYRSDDLASATSRAFAISRVLTYPLTLVGLFVLLFGFLFAGLGHVVLGALLIILGNAHHLKRHASRPLPNHTVADAMTRDPVTVTPDMSLSRIFDQQARRIGFNLLPVVENGVLLGRIDGDVVADIDHEHWESTKANDIFVDLSADQQLSVGTSVAEVFDIIARTGQRKFLVTDAEKLVGVLTLADLAKYLAPRATD